jgi:hypothetical protein
MTPIPASPILRFDVEIALSIFLSSDQLNQERRCRSTSNAQNWWILRSSLGPEVFSLSIVLSTGTAQNGRKPPWVSRIALLISKYPTGRIWMHTFYKLTASWNRSSGYNPFWYSEQREKKGKTGVKVCSSFSHLFVVSELRLQPF